MVKQPKKEDRLLSPQEVAAIWNEMALAMGYQTNYTSDSVAARRNRGRRSFEPDVSTPHMTLYHESRARAVKLYPKKSQKIEPEMQEEVKPSP